MTVIRRAEAADMRPIMELVDEVFWKEQGIPRSLNPIPPEKRPQWWCVREGAEIVGTLAAYWEDGACRLGRLTVAPLRRRRRLGEGLLRFALGDLFAQDVPQISMEARPVTVGILQKLGAEAVGEPFPFYRGTVTPLLLTREAFLRNAR